MSMPSRADTRQPAHAPESAQRDGTMERARDGAGGLIVVGVDTSEGAKAALRFAVEEARLRQAKLRVIQTWQVDRALITRPVRL